MSSLFFYLNHGCTRYTSTGCRYVQFNGCAVVSRPNATIFQQCGLEMASDSSAAVEQTADNEVLLETDISTTDKFTVEQLTKKRKRNEKATQGQQTFAVSFNVKTVLHGRHDPTRPCCQRLKI